MVELPRYVVSWVGPGTPFWDGPPSPARISAIRSLTSVDSQGRVYYRLTESFPLRRLRTDTDYRALSDAVDRRVP